MYRITSFTSHQTAEGERLSFTYSEINEETGQLVKSNQRENFILLDPEMLSKVEDIRDFVLSRIQG